MAPSPAIAAVTYTVYFGLAAMRGKLARTVPLRFNRRQSMPTGAAGVTFAAGIGVGTFLLMGLISFKART